MKKALSIILALTLVVCGLPLFSTVSVAADNELSVGGVYNVNIPENDGVVYTFSPTVNGLYFLTADSNEDTFCELYDISNEIVVPLFQSQSSKDDAQNFALGFNLEVGKTYKYVVSAQRVNELTYSGNVTLTFTKEKAIKSITNASYDHNIIVHTGGCYSNYYPDFDAMTWVNCEEYYNYDIYLENITGTITYEDDTTVSGTLYDYIFMDDMGIGEIQSGTNEYTVGDNSVDFFVYNVPFSFNLTIVESEISNISATISPSSCIQNCCGGFTRDPVLGSFNSDNYTPYYFFYDFSLEDLLSSFTITFNNGDTRTFTKGEDTVQSQLFEEYGYSVDVRYVQSYEHQLTLGDNSVGIEFMGVSDTVNYSITSSEIAFVTPTFTKTSSYVCSDGYFLQSPVFNNEIGVWEFEEWYYYDFGVDNIETLKIELKDGTIKNYLGTDIANQVYEELGYQVSLYTTQEQTHWTANGDNPFYLVVADVLYNEQYTINPCPIEDISFSNASASITEGSHRENCAWYDEYGDFCCNYNCYIFDADDFGDITVTFSDGRAQKVFGGDNIKEDINSYFGEDIEFYTDQSPDNEWGVGENTVNFRIQGYEDTIPITILEDPVTSFSATLAKNSTFYQTEGSWITDVGWDPDLMEDTTNERFMYAVHLASLTINLSDGTTETYTGDENSIETQLKADYPTFGFRFEMNQDPEHIWNIGSNTVSVYLNNQSTDLTFTVLECPIENITVVSKTTFSEGTGGGLSRYFDEEYCIETTVYEYHYNEEDFTSVTIEYKNGTQKTYTGTNIPTQIRQDTGYDLTVTSDQSQTNEWGSGEHNFVIGLMGYTQNLPVTIVENNIEEINVIYKSTYLRDVDGREMTGVWFDESNEEHTETYYGYDPNDNIYIIEITYTDGTVKAFTTQSFYEAYGENIYVESSQFNSGWCQGTGVFVVDVYALNVGQKIIMDIVEDAVRVVTGDFNCDGNFDNFDLKLYEYAVVGYVPYDNEDLTKLDLNGDTVIDGFDLAVADLYWNGAIVNIPISI